jgi:hypothetical protein
MVWGSVMLEDYNTKFAPKDSIEEHHNQC